MNSYRNMARQHGTAGPVSGFWGLFGLVPERSEGQKGRSPRRPPPERPRMSVRTCRDRCCHSCTSYLAEFIRMHAIFWRAVFLPCPALNEREDTKQPRLKERGASWDIRPFRASCAKNPGAWRKTETSVFSPNSWVRGLLNTLFIIWYSKY